jgi:hypothetical protein
MVLRSRIVYEVITKEIISIKTYFAAVQATNNTTVIEITKH